jgi:hypothetical protein
VRVPRAAARAAAQRGVRIDAYAIRRPPVADLAIEDVDVPQEIAVGEPFRYSVWVRSDATRTVPVRIEREGRVLFEGTRALRPGLNRLVFADRHERIGLQRYTVEVGDVAATPAGGADAGRPRAREQPRRRRHARPRPAPDPPRVAGWSDEGRLADALARVGTEVVVTAPRVGAARPRRPRLRARGRPRERPGRGPAAGLAPDAAHLGPGLRRRTPDDRRARVLRCGRATARVPVEDVLPVSLEVRQEQRRFGLAMAIALDRSGSMSCAGGSGR